MEILKELKNHLLNRKEIVAIIESDSLPSRDRVAQMISEKMKKPIENIVVERIKGQFGTNVFEIEARIYDDFESKDRYETITKKERKRRAEEAKKVAEEAKKAREEAKNSNQKVSEGEDE